MARRFPTAFDERNKIVIAVIALTLLIAGFFTAFYADSLPVIGGGTQRTAYFAESGGLKAGNEVRVAGVKVGKVSKVDLVGDKVEVTFRTKGVHLGDQTTAAIKVKTLLGQKYLALDPSGTADLASSIPLERTTTPYDVAAAFSDLSDTVDEIDTEKMEESMNVLADAFKNTPAAVKSMVTGLTDLSRTISTRDTQLSELFEQTSSVSQTLAGRNTEFAALIEDGDALLSELEARRTAVKQMLRGTAALGKQVRGLVADNNKTLAPALAKLDEVSKILNANQASLDRALADIGPYYRMLTNAMGNGSWVDAYMCGLFDATGAPELQNNVVRNCKPGGSK